MARFTIYSKDGKTERYSGKPTYNGTYLKPSYVEFREIVSPEPIPWQVGDYVDYGRTGLRYKLYSVPQPKKQARRNSVEDAFVYENVQFYAATKMLERAIFHDVVKTDNNIHFSTRDNLTTYEDVYGIATRIQECMDEIYPGMWTIKVMDGITEASAPELYAQLHEAKEFSISGSCLDALTNIYNTWATIGWVHSYDSASGKDVITIGRPNVRADVNSTSQFLYGKGNGLTAIKKSYTNGEDLATRLYVYGSERNLTHRYYNSLDICNADSVDIANLMLPVRTWGLSDDGKGSQKPDARKAYIEKDGPVSEYGIIPKRVYFDGTDNDEIYPSIENFTVGGLRAAKEALGETEYVPSSLIYDNPKERLDEIMYADRISDSGLVSGDSGENFDTVLEQEMPEVATVITGKNPYVLQIADVKLKDASYKGRVSVKTNATIALLTTYRPNKVSLRLTLSAYKDSARDASELQVVDLRDEDYQIIETGEGDLPYRIEITIPAIIGDSGQETFNSLILSLYIRYEYTSGHSYSKDGYCISEGTLSVGYKEYMVSTFKLRIKQIGFDISKRQSTGNGIATISMKTGMCGGRDFTVTGCRYVKDIDGWELTLKRTLDESLNTYFPNRSYPIAPDDRFVILDIMMPGLYINVASERLLELAEEMYSKVSKGQSYYEPEVDAKVMAKSGRVLREGMYMCISDEDIIGIGNEYVLIDTLTIDESDEAIPTYKVTLREKKGVSYKESVTNAIDNISSKIVLIGGLARQAQNGAYNAGESVQDVDIYSKRSFAQAKEMINKLNGAVEGFTDGITPVSVQAMSLLVGSENLQFTFVSGFDDITPARPYPISFNPDTKVLTCKETFIQHTTMGIDDITPVSARTASDYYIWKMKEYTSLALDSSYASKSYYLYAKVNAYDKETADETKKVGEFVLTEEVHKMIESERDYYLLVGILSSESNGARSFARLHGYSEILPGQITTDRIRSASGGSYIDLQTGNMQLGEKLKYIGGVLTLDFLFSEGANIGGFIFRNGRLESANGATWLDGVNGKMLLTGGFSGKITAESLVLPFTVVSVPEYTLKPTDPTNIWISPSLVNCNFTLPDGDKKFDGMFLNLYWEPILTKNDAQAFVKGKIYCPNRTTLNSSGSLSLYYASSITSRFGGITQLVNVDGQWTLLNGSSLLEYTKY